MGYLEIGSGRGIWRGELNSEGGTERAGEAREGSWRGRWRVNWRGIRAGGVNLWRKLDGGTELGVAENNYNRSWGA